ncbi:MAG: Kelch repeat-containing protein [Acidimicrobiales bacterium]
MLAAGTDLLVLGGLDASGTSVATVSCANPATGAVRQVASLDQPTHDAGGAVLGSKDLVVGGGATGVFDSVQAYRGGCAQAGGATTLSGALPRPRADLSVAQGGGTAYVAGGYDGKTLDPAVLATTDGASFRTVGQLPTPVRYAAVAVVGPYLYVIGGKTSSGSDTAAIQRMDTATGTTTVVGQLPAPVDGAEAVVLGGEIWVLGGIVGGHPTNDIVSVDPTTHAVSLAGHLPEAVANAGATVAGGIGWLAGGEGPQALDAVVRVAVS